MGWYLPHSFTVSRRIPWYDTVLVRDGRRHGVPAWADFSICCSAEAGTSICSAEGKNASPSTIGNLNSFLTASPLEPPENDLVYGAMEKMGQEDSREQFLDI